LKEKDGSKNLGHRWKDNFIMDLWETWWESVDWMHLAQAGDDDRLL
jgi:hypothetical protein